MLLYKPRKPSVPHTHLKSRRITVQPDSLVALVYRKAVAGRALPALLPQSKYAHVGAGVEVADTESAKQNRKYG